MPQAVFKQGIEVPEHYVENKGYMEIIELVVGAWDTGQTGSRKQLLRGI